MRIEVWSDIVCPWCGLGNHRLDKALRRFTHRAEVELIHRSFVLDPNMPEGAEVSVRTFLGRKHGLSPGQVETGTRELEALAAREGLRPYIVLDNKVASTIPAHELLAYASSQGKNGEAWNRMFHAYFAEAGSIFTTDGLLELASEMGLDRGEAGRALQSREFRQQVLDETQRAQRSGARGVPFALVDGRYAVSGAQDADTLLSLLQKIWNDSHPSTSAHSVDRTPMCGPDGCVLQRGEGPRRSADVEEDRR
jgi:predicted DsbA family dithiol-disulfide isomerase